MKSAVGHERSTLSPKQALWSASWVVAALMLGAATPAWAGRVQARLSPQETQVGIPVLLQITIENGQTNEAPAIPHIPDVHVHSLGIPSQSMQTTVVNGVARSSSSVTWSYELTPSKDGRFTVPAIEVETDTGLQKTSPITLLVNKSLNQDRLLVEIKGDRKMVYVGESLELTLQIWVKPAADLSGGTLPAHVMWGLIERRRSKWGNFVEPLQQQLNQHRSPDGREEIRKDSQGIDRGYYLYEIKHTLQANRPGQLTLDPVNIFFVYPERLGQDVFGRLQMVEQSMLTAQATVEPIEVLPVPMQNRPVCYSGAVGIYQIQTTAKPTEVTVGDPITLTLTVNGTRNLQELQPPPLALLPELTSHFRVPTDPLAGEVTGEGKRFTVSIRANSEAVTEIPPIPFAYFDPIRQEFVTVRSQPIPLTVKPAEKLAMSQIVDSTGAHAPVANRLTEMSSGILANYTGMDEVLVQQAFVPGFGIWAALLLPPIGFIASFIWRRHSERLRTDVGFARKRRARRDAVIRLRDISSDFSSDGASQAAAIVSAALRQYVADRCNLPTGGMTRASVLEQLQRRSARADVIVQMDALLEECEGIHYAGAGTRSARELERMAMSCIENLEREKW